MFNTKILLIFRNHIYNCLVIPGKNNSLWLVCVIGDPAVVTVVDNSDRFIKAGEDLIYLTISVEAKKEHKYMPQYKNVIQQFKLEYSADLTTGYLLLFFFTFFTFFYVKYELFTFLIDLKKLKNSKIVFYVDRNHKSIGL
ncbi:hypothetical protein BpHYR1_015985 [Brachionus plicatilis]|uniref:Uncharacterized protein n=1 Tax=Brachionus plicatilis TaxID=10195 RepID=A0A3M7PAX9_BRAPC|nr:hypothetical protein BpHYR1_015985 [Brachionus plicatilis]